MHVARQPVLELREGQQAQPTVKSPTGIVLTTYQKAGLLVLVLGLLYYRFFMRRRRMDKICAHCGHRNPAHRTNCTKCSAPLFTAR